MVLINRSDGLDHQLLTRRKLPSTCHAPHLESQTTITPLTIEINGNTAISEDSYVHIAVLNHHLLGEPSPPTETQEGVHRAEWVKEADGWKIKHWGGIVEF